MESLILYKLRSFDLYIYIFSNAINTYKHEVEKNDSADTYQVCIVFFFYETMSVFMIVMHF